MPQPTRIDDLMLPPVAHGVKVISIGMFLRRSRGDEPLGAVAWRGPMLHRTVQQFLTDVYFGDLDVLLLDMPPGTGDVAISVGQLLPHADVLVVTTPQSAASDVAVRSGLVARQTGQRVIGVVENMAAMTLPDGTRLDLFGDGGGAEVAAALSTAEDAVPVLASIPLSPALRADGDAGAPVVVGRPGRPGGTRDPALWPQAIASEPRGLAAGRSLPVPPRCVGPYVASESNGGTIARAERRRRARDAAGSPRPARRHDGARGPLGRHRRVIEQRLADDAPRVVLTRVELAPVDVVEVLAHLVAHASCAPSR